MVMVLYSDSSAARGFAAKQGFKPVETRPMQVSVGAARSMREPTEVADDQDRRQHGGHIDNMTEPREVAIPVGIASVSKKAKLVGTTQHRALQADEAECTEEICT